MTRPALLDGRVAIITGASRGIGEAIARHMVASGASVVLASRKQEPLDALAAELGPRAFGVACHAGKPSDVEALFRKAVERFGKVDVLVNNAGTNPHNAPMLEADWAVFDKIFEVNLKGYYDATRQLARHLRGRKAPGVVVNVASVFAELGAPNQGIYAMTKASILSMTRTLALELGGDAIRVNAVAPGLIDTRFAEAAVSDPAFRDRVLARTALKRLGRPEDVAGAVSFLASDDASYITGTIVHIDGGWTAW
jgi:NAD(P)-dependent dehydrogenase (short-subunit alcohol dehydrogenase family)